MHSQIHVSQAEFAQPPQCPSCGGQMRLVPIVNDSGTLPARSRYAHL